MKHLKKLINENLLTAKILVVDDTEANLFYLNSLLKLSGFSSITCISDSREVLAHVAENEPDIILLDLMMPYLSGFDIMDSLSESLEKTNYLPILVLTADTTQESKQKALASGAHDFLHKPLNSTEVIQRTQNLLHTRYLHKQQEQQKEHLENVVKSRTQALAETISKLEQANKDILEKLARVAEYRDDLTGQHTHRVGDLAKQTAKILELDDCFCEQLGEAAKLHDIGKIGIPDSILQKPGSLTVEELMLMREHCQVGADLLEDSSFEILNLAQRIALTHHEHWDGSGYPQGLRGEAIPIEGRIVAVVDVYDALTHSRPYKRAWTEQEAIDLLKQESAYYFDPKIVAAFLQLLRNQTRVTTQREVAV